MAEHADPGADARGDARVHEGVRALAREAASGEVSRQQHLEGRARLIAAVGTLHALPARGRWPRWGSAATGSALAFAVVASALFFLLRVRAIGFRVEGSAGTDGAYVVAPAAASARIRFDEGSEVAVLAGGRARVGSTAADGAELVLEEGRADVHVVHRSGGAGTHWRVLAGPYVVLVTGTRFVVGWSGGAQTLRVTMSEGSVRVTGPGMGEGVALATTQALVARAGDASFEIGAAGSLAAFGDASQTTAAAASAARAPVIEASASASSAIAEPGSTAARSTPIASSAAPALAPTNGVASPSAPKAASWSALVAAGKSADVVAAAHTQGSAALERPLEDVQALADAARYTGDAALAERALLAIRRRFPGTANASNAAFLLGRVAEEQQGAPAKARTWYDRYLAEAPGGAFAADALGRKMLLVDRLDGRDAARPLARDYLTRFPKGAYAKSATTIAGGG